MLSGKMRVEQKTRAVQDDLDALEWESAESDACEEEVFEDDALLQSAIQSYQAESLAWAERRSATMGVPHFESPRPWSHRAAAPALAATLAVLMSAVIVREHRSVATLNRARIAEPSAQTIASDNLLLSSVSAALDQDPAPTERDLGIDVHSLHASAMERTDQARSIGNVR